MNNREIKFRVWERDTDKNQTPIEMRYCDSFKECAGIEEYYGNLSVWMQFTGHKTIQGRELYEGDIVFVEEEEDNKDVRYYLVIVWIPEWSMFASLHLNEYQKFLLEGYKALDEVMFWTYTLETAEQDFHYAGNIFEKPELLES